MTAPARFLEDRPPIPQAPPPWNQLAYILRELPAAIERLSAELPRGRVLDYGCAHLPYRRLFEAHTEYLAADLPGNPLATVEIAADGTVPVADASVDAVLSTQVLEHVADPGLYLSECRRVLRPGGRLLLSTHGIMVYHPDPVDYWRWTCAGLRRAVEQAGLEVVGFEGVMGLAATGLQLVQDSLFFRAPRRVRPALALLLQSLIRVADRFEPKASRDMNALVFALVAEKP